MLTLRLHLLAASQPHLEALIAGPEAFRERFGFLVEEGYLEFPGTLEFSLKQLQEHPGDTRWWEPRLIIFPAGRALIGLCGFKGPPDVTGQVEIGYGIAPAHRGLGYATEAAAALIAFAFRQASVTAVRAHTLAMPSASTRILEKCGFVHVGELFDEDDGRIWRWEKARAEIPFATHAVPR